MPDEGAGAEISWAASDMASFYFERAEPGTCAAGSDTVRWTDRSCRGVDCGADFSVARNRQFCL